MTEPVDVKTRAQIGDEVKTSAKELRERAEEDQRALGIEDESTASSDSLSAAAHEQIESASPGAVPVEAYPNEPVAAAVSTNVFDTLFVDAQLAFMAEVSGNPNLALRASLVTAERAIGDLLALATQILSEAGQLTILAASLGPADRVYVAQRRDATSRLARESDAAAGDLLSASARRRAAKKAAGGDLQTPRASPSGIGLVQGRDLEPTTGRTDVGATLDPGDVDQTLAAPQNSDVTRQSTRQGVVSASLFGVTAEVRGLDLSRIDQIALCAALHSMATSKDTQARATRAAAKLKAIMDAALAAADDGFLATIGSAIQELAAGTMSRLASAVQDKLDAIDTWLSTPLVTANTTIVTTVDTVGERSAVTPVTDSLAAACGLSKERFCEAFGTLELTLAIDSAMGIVGARPPAIGRAVLLVDAPEPVDFTPPITRPDRELRMILAQPLTAGVSTTVVARAEATRVVSPVPDFTAHRDTFTNVYEASPSIGGGPGSMIIAGEDETTETLNYSSSSFNQLTGLYTFTLTAPPTAAHRVALIGRARANDRQLLFRGSVTSPATRFNVSGTSITHPTNPTFAFSPTISIGDVLLVGDDPVAVTVTGVAAGLVTINSQHLGNKSNVTLSRITTPPAPSTTITGFLASDVRRDLGLEALGIGSSQALVGRLSADTDINTRITREDGKVTNGPGYQELQTFAPMFRSDDVNAFPKVELGVQTSGSRRLRSPISSVVSPFIVRFTGQQLTGSISTSSGTSLNGVGTKFTKELVVGDYVRVGTEIKKIDAIATDTSATVDTAWAGTVSGSVFLMAAPSSGNPIGKQFVRSFSISRAPAENKLDFTSVTRVTTDKFTFTLTAPSTFGHGPQDVTVPGSVNIVPGSLTDFPTTPTNADPRLDPDTVPPGSTVIRGTFQDPAQATVLGPLISLAGGIVHVGDDDLPYTAATNLGGGSYSFTLASPTVNPYIDGQRMEVETSSVLTQLPTFFPPTWFTPIDDWLRGLANAIKLADARLCRLLQGRPADIAPAAAQMAAGATAAIAVLAPLQLAVQGMILGLEESPRLQAAIDQARNAGMDKAAEAMESGNIELVATMTSAEATSEGQALARVQEYKLHVTITSDSVKVESMATQLRGEETSKKLLATQRAGFKVAARDEITKRIQATKALEGSAQEVVGD